RIDIAYEDGQISRAWSGSRKWEYEYLNGQLVAVTLPDTSKWKYETLSYSFMPWYEPSNQPMSENCVQPGLGQDNFNFKITHPSGAVGEFGLDFMRQFRAGTPPNCTARIIW